MKVRPITLKDANIYVIKNHRHHDSVVGHKFAICVKDYELVDDEYKLVVKGVAICSRPVAQKTGDNVLEVSRCCVKDCPNACSMLYAACARIAKEMGYDKIQTFILQRETGISLKATGWICEDEKAGGNGKFNKSAERQNKRPTTDLFGNEKKYPTEFKQRWVKYFTKQQKQLLALKKSSIEKH